MGGALVGRPFSKLCQNIVLIGFSESFQDRKQPMTESEPTKFNNYSNPEYALSYRAISGVFFPLFYSVFNFILCSSSVRAVARFTFAIASARSARARASPLRADIRLVWR
jgi:hypothetical protein